MTTHLPHPPTADGPPLSRRERARAATIDEIKETATRLMSEQGTTDLRFSDIAREMGMTAPALYRYFSDRDELLTALIADTYDELGAAVAAARALEFVRPGMRLGLGTGPTAKQFVELVGERVRRRLQVVGLHTSDTTRRGPHT